MSVEFSSYSYSYVTGQQEVSTLGQRIGNTLTQAARRSIVYGIEHKNTTCNTKTYTPFPCSAAKRLSVSMPDK